MTTDFDRIENRYDWLRPVGIEAREADILADGLQDPLTLLQDHKAGDYFIAFDQARADELVAATSDEGAMPGQVSEPVVQEPEGLDALGLDEKETATFGEFSQGQRDVAEELVAVALGEGETIGTFEMADAAGYSDAFARQTLRKFWEAGLATREGSRNEGYDYAPTQKLVARLENENGG